MFWEMYEEFGLHLPKMTMAIFSIYFALITLIQAMTLVIGNFLLLLATLISNDALPGCNRFTRFANRTSIAISFTIVAVYAMGLAIPLVALVSGSS